MGEETWRSGLGGRGFLVAQIDSWTLGTPLLWGALPCPLPTPKFSQWINQGSGHVTYQVTENPGPVDTQPCVPHPKLLCLASSPDTQTWSLLPAAYDWGPPAPLKTPPLASQSSWASSLWCGPHPSPPHPQCQGCLPLIPQEVPAAWVTHTERAPCAAGGRGGRPPTLQVQAPRPNRDPTQAGRTQLGPQSFQKSHQHRQVGSGAVAFPKHQHVLSPGPPGPPHPETREGDIRMGDGMALQAPSDAN